jgi:hypothetical protein
MTTEMYSANAVVVHDWPEQYFKHKWQVTDSKSNHVKKCVYISNKNVEWYTEHKVCQQIWK